VAASYPLRNPTQLPRASIGMGVRRERGEQTKFARASSRSGSVEEHVAPATAIRAVMEADLTLPCGLRSRSGNAWL
jgi:hypothetical protein